MITFWPSFKAAIIIISDISLHRWNRFSAQEENYIKFKNGYIKIKWLKLYWDEYNFQKPDWSPGVLNTKKTHTHQLIGASPVSTLSLSTHCRHHLRQSEHCRMEPEQWAAHHSPWDHRHQCLTLGHCGVWHCVTCWGLRVITHYSRGSTMNCISLK